MIHWKKCLSITMMAMVLSWSLPLQSAYASMVSTSSVIHAEQLQQQREKVAAFLQRADVRQQLEKYGVAAADARARVDSLSDEEVGMLAARIDQVPAGGDAVGAVVSAFVIVFLVLLVTDIVGLTDVFPFVKAQR